MLVWTGSCPVPWGVVWGCAVPCCSQSGKRQLTSWLCLRLGKVSSSIHLQWYILWTLRTRRRRIMILLAPRKDVFDVTSVGRRLSPWPKCWVSWPSLTLSQAFEGKCVSEVVRIGSIIVFHLSKLWRTKFFILCDGIFLARLNLKLFKLCEDELWKLRLNLSLCAVTADSKSKWPHDRKAYVRGVDYHGSNLRSDSSHSPFSLAVRDWDWGVLAPPSEGLGRVMDLPEELALLARRHCRWLWSMRWCR